MEQTIELKEVCSFYLQINQRNTKSFETRKKGRILPLRTAKENTKTDKKVN